VSRTAACQAQVLDGAVGEKFDETIKTCRNYEVSLSIS
jgi:hypothetical protein